ncbi:MAG: DUF4838 domain-containing protein [Bacteroidales bacterium]|nr:DUF4838 domain-containing protein [Bacteroidales bacterium]
MHRTVIFIVFALACAPVFSQHLNIVMDGSTNYTIIIPKQASKNDSVAASYLSEYILKMTGVSIPVFKDDRPRENFEINIGNTNRQNFAENHLPPDGFGIKTSGNHLMISGGSHKGTIYGVIELLERWGCRKFSPDEIHVPAYDNLILPQINFRDEPANELRIINGRMTIDPEFVDWLRISTIGEMSPPGFYVHTFERLVPRSEYFEDHPEYYARLGNKYSFDQLCPSNPEVKELIIQRLGEEMAKFPEFEVWSVSQNDNFTFCHCDKCLEIIEEEGSPAGPVIRLVNDVAAVFPDKTISTLAYQFSRPAPQKTKPSDNVMVMLCTIELNRSQPIETDSSSQSFVKDITDWGKICNNIYLWDYTINFNHSISPFPNLHVLQPNLQFFYENNVRKQFPQSNLLEGLEFVEYRARLLSALLWDPYVDLDSVKTDFLEYFYGEAAPFIQSYSERMESELLRSGKILYIYEPPNNHAEGYLSAENIADYNRLFDQAEDAVKALPKMLNRVKIARLPLQYAIMEIGKNDMFGPRGWYFEKDGKFILRDDMKNTLEEFHAVCQGNLFITLNERSLSPETYYLSTLRFIDVQVEGNFAFRKPVTAEPLPEPKYASGDPSILTDGVQGAHDFNVHWLGWWGKDAIITVDLEKPVQADVVSIGTLWDGKSWILHPSSITCLVSEDGKEFLQIDLRKVEGDQQDEPVTRKFEFKTNGITYRYVRFNIQGFGNLPRWHASEGEPAWFFVDEITVN